MFLSLLINSSCAHLYPALIHDFNYSTTGSLWSMLCIPRFNPLSFSQMFPKSLTNIFITGEEVVRLQRNSVLENFLQVGNELISYDGKVSGHGKNRSLNERVCLASQLQPAPQPPQNVAAQRKNVEIKNPSPFNPPISYILIHMYWLFLTWGGHVFP